MAFIKTEEKPRWGDFKKRLEIMGGSVVDKETGEIVEGVTGLQLILWIVRVRPADRYIRLIYPHDPGSVARLLLVQNRPTAPQNGAAGRNTGPQPQNAQNGHTGASRPLSDAQLSSGS